MDPPTLEVGPINWPLSVRHSVIPYFRHSVLPSVREQVFWPYLPKKSLDFSNFLKKSTLSYALKVDYIRILKNKFLILFYKKIGQILGKKGENSLFQPYLPKKSLEFSNFWYKRGLHLLEKDDCMNLLAKNFLTVFFYKKLKQNKANFHFFGHTFQKNHLISIILVQTCLVLIEKGWLYIFSS